MDKLGLMGKTALELPFGHQKGSKYVLVVSHCKPSCYKFSLVINSDCCCELYIVFMKIASVHMLTDSVADRHLNVPATPWMTESSGWG